MADQITSGSQGPGTTHAFPMPQDQTDNTPVVNVPASAVPPGMMNAPHPYESQLTTIVVNGQAQQVDHAKLVEMAQKGVSSDARYQEASAMSREAQDAINLKADLELISETGDIGAFRRAGALMGLSGDEVEEAARVVYEQSEEGDDSPGHDQYDENDLYEEPRGRGGQMNVNDRIAALEAALAETKGQLRGRTTRFSDLDPSLQTVVVEAEQIRVDKIIQNALDSDDVLSYYMNSYDPRGQQAVRDMIDERVRGRLDATDGSFGDGNRILREVVPEVRTILEAIGNPNRSTPQMGLGPAPGGQGEANIYPTKQPDHVPSTEANFEEHIAETLAFNAYNAHKSGQ